MAYNELNRLKWKGGLADAKVTIRHRGAKKTLRTEGRSSRADEKLIFGKDITGVGKTYFLFINERGEEVHIPMHRIIKIEHEGRVLWRKRSP